MSRLRSTTLVAAASVVAFLLTGSAHPAPGSPSGNPDPSLFKHPGSNAYFPLTPGLVTRLHGTDDGQRYKELVRVTAETKVLAGVTATVVHDVLRRADGSVAEATDDYYATDRDGNVWYFGEDTATYDKHGHVASREGTWHAGVDGAVAGVLMPADPQPSTAAYQEYLPGVAEDQGWVVQRLASVKTPGGRYDDIVRTLEWSRLEPGVVSTKFYARGLGIVSEKDMSGGTEHFWLVSHRS